MSSEWAIRVSNLSKTYRVYDRPHDRARQWIVPPIQKAFHRTPTQYYREVHALEDVSFEINRGETLGIIGRNGSGKSTLLQLIVGTVAPTSGRIETQGRVAALLELGAGFHPEFTGRENVWLNATLLGLSQGDIKERLDHILAFAEIGAAIDQPVKTYSSGMVMRLAFAVIAHVQADILIIDEALAVGDAFFVQKCMRFLRTFMAQGTVVFVSHDSAAVLSLCRKALWLEQGRVAGMGEAKTVCDGYLHGGYALPNQVKTAEGDEPRLGKLEVDKATSSGSAKMLALNLRDCEQRPSGRQAWIERITFSNESGCAIHTVTTRERVFLRVWCVSSVRLTNPIVGFLVRNRFGQSLFGANTCMSGNTLPEQLPMGTQFLAELEFVMPVLEPGDYAMSLALADGSQQQHVQHHWVHDALAFTSSPLGSCFGLIAVEMVRAQITGVDAQGRSYERTNHSIAL
ncbi:MAG TPA: ABC transporter ATP-binding protein [Nitrospira sp.]|nr:ABC transporter ATP-binding protein [Nitrospira sp. NTP1]HQR14415.1 ABC transporter ATP-binding protein [Nitrospira sp.]HQV09990.1 ABC transporter ATP-binding protein [Nitrospira sp.]